MTPFPVSSSILSATHLNEFLKKTYHLPADLSCRLIKAGVNHTYMVAAATENYVFRLYSLGWRTKIEIEEELRLIGYLKKNNNPVSFPIADKVGNYIQQLQAPEGIRFAVLFSYAKGEKLLNYSPGIHYRIGEIIAGIHKSSIDFPLKRVTYNAENLIAEPFELLKQFVSEKTDEMIFMSSAREYLLKLFHEADITQLRTGAVHLDIWFDNLNINSDDEVTLFDFDFCGNGWLCLDIAYYLLQLFVVEPEETAYRVRLENFLKGYESITPLTAEEKRIIPLLGTSLYFFYLGVQCARFENWSNTFINDTYLKRFIVARVMRYFEFSKTLVL